MFFCIGFEIACSFFAMVQKKCPKVQVEEVVDSLDNEFMVEGNGTNEDNHNEIENDDNHVEFAADSSIVVSETAWVVNGVS